MDLPKDNKLVLNGTAKATENGNKTLEEIKNIDITFSNSNNKSEINKSSIQEENKVEENKSKTSNNKENLTEKNNIQKTDFFYTENNNESKFKDNKILNKKKKRGRKKKVIKNSNDIIELFESDNGEKEAEKKDNKGNITSANNEIIHENTYYDKILILIKKHSLNKIINCLIKYREEFNKNPFEINDKEDQIIMHQLNNILFDINKDCLILLLIQILNDQKNNNKNDNCTININQIIKNSTVKRQSNSNTENIITDTKTKKINKSVIQEKNNKSIIQEKNNNSMIQGKISKIKKDNSEIINLIGKKETKKSRKKSIPSINDKNQNFYFTNHYYKVENKVYSYFPKRKVSYFNHYSFYCTHSYGKEACRAKIIINQKKKLISVIGKHKSFCHTDIGNFIKNFPELKNIEWSHLQMINKNGKNLIYSKC